MGPRNHVLDGGGCILVPPGEYVGSIFGSDNEGCHYHCSSNFFVISLLCIL